MKPMNRFETGPLRPGKFYTTKHLTSPQERTELIESLGALNEAGPQRGLTHERMTKFVRMEERVLREPSHSEKVIF